MLAARRAYAKALHLAPHVGLHWGDAAALFSQQAELLRAHPALGSAANPQLLGQAERLLKGEEPPAHPYPGFCQVAWETLSALIACRQVLRDPPSAQHQRAC